MTQGLNGETVFKVEDVLVGYVPGESYGYRRDLEVTVSVNMEQLDRQDTYETTEHEQVSRPLSFSVTSDVWRPGRSDIVEGGAGAWAVQQIITSGRFADGWDEHKARELVTLAAWHLNHVTAGCAHQAVVMEDSDYGQRPSLDLTAPCPETGYRYGHAWLLRPLPDGFEQQIRNLFA